MQPLKFLDRVLITDVSFFEGVEGLVIDKRNHSGGEYLVMFDDPRIPHKWVSARKLIQASKAYIVHAEAMVNMSTNELLGTDV